MNNKIIFNVIFALSLLATELAGAASVEAQQAALLQSYRSQKNVFEMADFTGQTYLSFMRSLLTEETYTE